MIEERSLQSMDESANADIVSNLTQSLPVVKDPDRLAVMVLKEGKTFVYSAVQCGYSLNSAKKGQAWLIAHSKPVADAFRRVTASLALSLDKLKPLAVRRLHDEIINPKSSLGIKAIELAGRFKETDWFVRNVDVQIGVFASLGERSPAEDTLETYKDE